MNRIKQLRNEKGINQEVLAKLLGLETAGISKLETGRVPLKDEYIIKLAEYFQVSTDYLLGKSSVKNPEVIEIDVNKIVIALSKKDYAPPTKEQQDKIEDYAKFVLKDNVINKENKKDK